MRSVQSESYKKFTEKPCDCQYVLDEKLRKTCRRCRFEKCLSVGMKISYVKSNQKNEITKPISIKFSADNEQEILKYWTSLWCPSLFDSQVKLYSENGYQMARHVRGLNSISKLCAESSEDDRKFDQHLGILMMQSLALNYFKMKNQSTCDALKLFKLNSRSMCSFYYILSTFSNVSYLKSLGFNSCSFKIGFVLQINMNVYIGNWFCKYVNENSQEIENGMEVLTTLMQLVSETYCQQLGNDHLNSIPNLNNIEGGNDHQNSINEKNYEAFFQSPCPWANHIDVEIEHEKIVRSITEWYQKAKNPTSEDVDSIIIILAMQIILLNTDGLTCQLKDKSFIEKSQQKYASLLHYYLKLHHGENSYSLFSKALMLNNDSRRACDLSLQRLNLY